MELSRLRLEDFSYSQLIVDYTRLIRFSSTAFFLLRIFSSFHLSTMAETTTAIPRGVLASNNPFRSQAFASRGSQFAPNDIVNDLDGTTEQEQQERAEASGDDPELDQVCVSLLQINLVLLQSESKSDALLSRSLLTLRQLFPIHTFYDSVSPASPLQRQSRPLRPPLMSERHRSSSAPNVNSPGSRHSFRLTRKPPPPPPRPIFPTATDSDANYHGAVERTRTESTPENEKRTSRSDLERQEKLLLQRAIEESKRDTSRRGSKVSRRCTFCHSSPDSLNCRIWIRHQKTMNNFEERSKLLGARLGLHGHRPCPLRSLPILSGLSPFRRQNTNQDSLVPPTPPLRRNLRTLLPRQNPAALDPSPIQKPYHLSLSPNKISSVLHTQKKNLTSSLKVSLLFLPEPARRKTNTKGRWKC
jgi:hypothetical protein